MWVNREKYVALLTTATESRVDIAHFRTRLSELKDQIVGLRHEVEVERARANAAVDAMLVEKGHPPVSVTEMPDPTAMFDEDPDEVQTQARAIAEYGLASVLREAQ